MKVASLINACLSVLILIFLTGCASITGGQISGVNWALDKNGGRITTFAEEPDHPATTLNNGITSSEMWDQGEGWAASIMKSSGGRRSYNAQRDEHERYWIIVELAQPVTVSNVKLYTVDSEQYPADEYGVSDLLIQYEMENALKEKLWANIDKLGKGIGDQDNVIRDNITGVIDVRFRPVKTQRIRILIYGTNDLTRTEDNSGAQQGMIRLTEIEVYGTGKHEGRDELEMLFNE
ncbi:hypothetical protein GF312_01700 [Candidatus Poribacteria bacterium]|nr:hypothetical protein [Candidatus Poribacteria bacterium]